MTAPNGLRAIPADDRAWLMAALGDALSGGAPILPLAEGVDAEAVESLQHAELPEGTAVVVRTSGSSGIPKAVALSAAALRASADATHERLGGAGQWLVTLPAQLISGLQMLVRSEIAGAPPVFYDGGFDPEAMLDTASRLEADRRYVSLVPVQFLRLLDLAERDRIAADSLRSFDAVLVGGQAVPLEMRRRAHELGVSLKRSYGMTETAGGCVYDGVEIGGTRVRLRGGEVQLAGPMLSLGYVGDPALTAERFVEDEGRDGTVTRWYRTGDAGEMLGGMLTVTGRRDRVIISGGINVSLDEVERVVRDIDGWSSAVAVGGPHPEWGERVGLVVEIEQPERGGATARVSFEDVRDAIRDRLGPAAAPDWATEIDEIPRLPGGKPDLRAIEEWLGRLRASFGETSAIRRRGKHAAGVAGAADAVDPADASPVAEVAEIRDPAGSQNPAGAQEARDPAGPDPAAEKSGAGHQGATSTEQTASAEQVMDTNRGEEHA